MVSTGLIYIYILVCSVFTVPHKMQIKPQTIDQVTLQETARVTHTHIQTHAIRKAGGRKTIQWLLTQLFQCNRIYCLMVHFRVQLKPTQDVCIVYEWVFVDFLLQHATLKTRSGCNDSSISLCFCDRHYAMNPLSDWKSTFLKLVSKQNQLLYAGNCHRIYIPLKFIINKL